MVKNFKRYPILGTTLSSYGNRVNIVAKIEYADGRLSFSGSIDAVSSGQIVDHILTPDFQPSEGRTIEDIQRVVGYWKRWHLNDMNAACEHQRQLPKFSRDSDKRVTVIRYELVWDVAQKLGKQATADVRRDGMVDVALFATPLGGEEIRVDYDPEYPFIMGVGNVLRVFNPEKGSGLWDAAKFSPSAAVLCVCKELGISPFNKKFVSDDKIRAAIKKVGGWRKLPKDHGTVEGFKKLLKVHTSEEHPAHLYEHEHPEGRLGCVCPECGYKYGSKWLKEDVPTEVLEFLKSF